MFLPYSESKNKNQNFGRPGSVLHSNYLYCMYLDLHRQCFFRRVKCFITILVRTIVFNYGRKNNISGLINCHFATFYWYSRTLEDRKRSPISHNMTLPIKSTNSLPIILKITFNLCFRSKFHLIEIVRYPNTLFIDFFKSTLYHFVR